MTEDESLSITTKGSSAAFGFGGKSDSLMTLFDGSLYFLGAGIHTLTVISCGTRALDNSQFDADDSGPLGHLLRLLNTQRKKGRTGPCYLTSSQKEAHHRGFYS